jgi:serine/threonine protein phosphatase PrpC
MPLNHRLLDAAEFGPVLEQNPAGPPARTGHALKIRPGIELGNITDVGCQREGNEDYYCYAEPENDEQFERKGRLIVVADGIGGHVGGEFASGILVEVLRATYMSSEIKEPDLALLDAVTAAHEAIQEFVREHSEKRGMGTTCTAAVLRNGYLYYVHVGDSRLYLLRDSRITRLTQDHTVVERLIEQGLLRADEAAAHPEHGVLTAAVGIGDTVAAEVPETPVSLLPDDILLLCTDGLHDLVNDEELQATAFAYPPSTACRLLVETAKSRGGYDNITVQILKVKRPEPDAERMGDYGE